MSKPLQRQQLEAELIERARQDAAFRAELLAHPRATVHEALRAYDLGIKSEITVHVHEETPATIHLVLPLSLAQEEDLALDDEMLDLVAGGVTGESVYMCEQPYCNCI